MAQIAVPESVSRELYNTYFELPKDYFSYNAAGDSLEDLVKALHESSHDRFVVKPDYTFGKRGKNNLLGLNLAADDVRTYLQERSSAEFNGQILKRFIISPFVQHDQEYYLSITTTATGDEVCFSNQGGMEIEEQWDSVKKLSVPVLDEVIDQTGLDMLLAGVAVDDDKVALEAYIKQMLTYFRKYGLAFLEVNPLVVSEGILIPLDFKARLDNCEFFHLQKYVDVYNLVASAADHTDIYEERVAKLDAMTDASLKLKVLEKNARVWPLVAGGGASIIYFDSLVEAGFAGQIGFYGEYSGNPPFELMHEYARVVIEMLLASNAQNKVLLIAGANANFTNIATTFKGIIKAIEENADQFVEQGVSLLVRRGGPFVEEAFGEMRGLAKRHNIPLIIEGVDYPLPHILQSIAKVGVSI